VRPRDYVSKYDALEVAPGDTGVVEENIKAVLRQVLENRERPRNIRAAITDKDGFFDAFHDRIAQTSTIAKAQLRSPKSGA
jgi:hypothetical protein